MYFRLSEVSYRTEGKGLLTDFVQISCLKVCRSLFAVRFIYIFNLLLADSLVFATAHADAAAAEGNA